VGETTFYRLPLLTARGHVMTPRAASEQLVVEALKRIGGRAARVVDVGTGSGAIAVAIATAAPSADVWATDTSRHAVALARANARRHGVGDRVSVIHGDLIEGVPDPIDLVVANLPYLALAEAARFPELAEEPEHAVFAPGDGLGPYRRLLAACAERLDDNAVVVIQLHRLPLAATGAELRRATARPLLAAA
jgi:release factor glutamine methyltransferase